jgi:hypothetical protein
VHRTEALGLPPNPFIFRFMLDQGPAVHSI